MTKAIDSTSQEDGWSSLSAVGSYLGNSHASFDPRNYGFAKLSSLAKAQDYLEVKQGTNGSAPRVRTKPAKAATQQSSRRRSPTKRMPTAE